MKEMSFLYLLASVLLCLSVITASAKVSPFSEELPPLTNSETTFDITLLLEKIGYTDANMSEAPEDLVKLLLTSYDNPIPSDSSAVILQPSGIDKSVFDQAIQKNFTLTGSKPKGTRSMATDYIGEKACLVVAIGDYAGGPDLNPWIGWAFANITYYASTYGDYDYVKTLENASATNYYVDNWIHWLCASYENVDVYLFGHGKCVPVIPGVWYYYAYMPYDAINADGSENSNNFYWDFYLQSDYDSYDHSSLRYMTAGFCEGWGFDNDARWPYWYPDFHDRAFNGGHGSVYADYHEFFAHQWGYLWYQQHYDSSSAADGARTYAYDHIHPNGIPPDHPEHGVPYTYGDTGSAIYA